MPELPEVEVVRRGLLPHVTGRTITRVDVREPRSLRRQEGGPEAFARAVTGARVRTLERRGKFLWWRLTSPAGEDTGEALMTHLGMSGQLRVHGPELPGDDLVVPGGVSAQGEDPADDPLGPGRDRYGRSQGTMRAADPRAESEGPAADPVAHRRVTLHLDGGMRVDFIDQRIFGGLWTSPLARTADGMPATADSVDDLLPRDVSAVGRDLLDPSLDVAAAVRSLRSRRAPVKALLLNQALISGIGNIYADEGLWAARTRYDSPGNALPSGRAERILEGTAEVMRRALDVGGTSFDALYVNVDGRSGYFARSLAVYGREGKKCRRCGTVIRRSVLQQRSCFSCPQCQRPLRRP